MIRFVVAAMLIPSGLTFAQSPYLTAAEEDALCEFWNLQYEHLRNTGEYASIGKFVSGSVPNYEPAWTTALGRFQLRNYWDVEENQAWTYEYYGLDLKAKESAGLALGVLLRPTGALFVFQGDSVTFTTPCTGSTGDPSVDRARVLDDLVAIRDSIWLYRLTLGQFPDALPISPSLGRYMNWAPEQRRWGHQYAYASDGTTFSLAAWPMRAETMQPSGFYLDQTGILRESLVGTSGPDDTAVLDNLPRNPAALGTYPRNEKRALAILCEIYHAQEAFKAETGYYTTAFADLQRLPSPPFFDRDMGYSQSGYNFNLGGNEQDFTANGNAVEYGITGNRGFFLDSSGNVRVRLGRDADPDSPILGTVCEIDESFQPTGESLPGPARVDADGDYRLSFSELLLLVQLYNVGEYHCAAETPDGYASGAGEQGCAPLEVDAGQDWRIDLSELLRGIQIFASGAYFPCITSEDGLCLPVEPVRFP